MLGAEEVANPKGEPVPYAYGYTDFDSLAVLCTYQAYSRQPRCLVTCTKPTSRLHWTSDQWLLMVYVPWQPVE